MFSYPSRMSCLAAFALLGMGPMSGALLAQNEGELVYKFSVLGVGTSASAKALQVSLLQHTGISSCVFIDACHCFKLSTSVALDHDELRSLVQSSGHVLEGAVDVSDGTVLTPPPPPPTQER